MKLVQYQVGSDQIGVEFNGRRARLDRVWEAIKSYRGLNDHDEHYLILSNQDRVLLYFSGNRSGKHFYIQGLSPFVDQPFKQWKALQRELEVNYLEVVTGADGKEMGAMFGTMGLELVTQRVVFTITDPSVVNFPTTGIQLQDESSLEEIAALCDLAKRKMVDATDILSSAAAGAIDVQMRFLGDGSKLSSALFYGTVADSMYVSEAFVCEYPAGTREYADEFLEHFRSLLGRCAREKKEFSIALASHAQIPEYDGITHEVRSHHYIVA